VPVADCRLAVGSGKRSRPAPQRGSPRALAAACPLHQSAAGGARASKCRCGLLHLGLGCAARFGFKPALGVRPPHVQRKTGWCWSSGRGSSPNTAWLVHMGRRSPARCESSVSTLQARHTPADKRGRGSPGRNRRGGRVPPPRAAFALKRGWRPTLPACFEWLARVGVCAL
jgi:hypothetical protein